jgi:hypothetical protein
VIPELKGRFWNSGILELERQILELLTEVTHTLVIFQLSPGCRHKGPPFEGGKGGVLQAGKALEIGRGRLVAAKNARRCSS